MDKIIISQYMDILRGKIYKILPIYEQSTFEIYQRNVRDLIDELSIFYKKNRHKYIYKLMLELECLLYPENKTHETAHSYVRRKTFESINTVNKIKQEIEGG